MWLQQGVPVFDDPAAPLLATELHSLSLRIDHYLADTAHIGEDDADDNGA
jgi:hypothetical protein